MDIDLSTDAAPSPERTIHLAETLPAVVRALNHATLHHEALKYPADADRLIREIAAAASRLPQLFGQAAAWLEQEERSGRVEVPSGWHMGDPEAAVTDARSYLREAERAASRLAEKLDAAARVTGTLAAREDDGDD